MAPKHPRPKVAESGPKRKEPEQGASAPSRSTATYERRAPSAAERGKAPMTSQAPQAPRGIVGRFYSEENKDWFHKSILDRPIFKEKVMLTVGCQEESVKPFYDQILSRNWSTLFFFHGKNRSCPSIVREFYANAKPFGRNHPGKFKSWVRGHVIDYAYWIINTKFGSHVPEGKQCSIKHFLEGEETCEHLKMLRILCKEDARWERDREGKPFRLNAADLLDVPKLWFLIIQNFIMPSLNTSQVQLKRAILLFALMEQNCVDIGRVIAYQIETAAGDRKSSLVFPALITRLCEDAGVNLANEQWEEPEIPFPLAHLKKRVDQKPRKSRRDPRTPATLRGISTQLHHVQQDVQELKIGQKEIKKDVKHIRGDFKIIKSMMSRLLASKYKGSTAGGAEEEAPRAANADDADDADEADDSDDADEADDSDDDDEQHDSDHEGGEEGSGDEMDDDDVEEEDDDDFDPADD